MVHGIGYFNACASYHMDKEIAQQIINKVLSNTSLKVLRLKSFQTINRCVVFEVDVSINKIHLIFPLQSPSLESLEAELGKSYEVGLLTLPRYIPGSQGPSNIDHLQINERYRVGFFLSPPLI